VDLATLVAALALGATRMAVPTVAPNVMHALIWEQSRGKPWSFTTSNNDQLRVHPTLMDAVCSAQVYPSDRLRIGLTSLPTWQRRVTAAMLLTCEDIARAARRIAEFAERCRRSHRPNSPVYCGISSYWGSWKRPDNTFANAVPKAAERGDSRT
jgi:hypothetical protein